MCSRSVLRMSIILHRLQLRLSHSLFLQIDYFIKYPHFRYHGSTSRTNLTIDRLCTGLEQKNSPMNHLQVMRSPAEHRQPFDEIKHRHTLNEIGDVAGNAIPCEFFAWGFSANRVALISHDYQFLHCTNVVIKFFSPD